MGNLIDQINEWIMIAKATDINYLLEDIPRPNIWHSCRSMSRISGWFRLRPHAGDQVLVIQSVCQELPTWTEGIFPFHPQVYCISQWKLSQRHLNRNFPKPKSLEYKFSLFLSPAASNSTHHQQFPTPKVAVNRIALVIKTFIMHESFSIFERKKSPH